MTRLLLSRWIEIHTKENIRLDIVNRSLNEISNPEHKIYLNSNILPFQSGEVECWVKLRIYLSFSAEAA